MGARVLLVNPPSEFLAYVRPGRASIARVHPPLGLASLAASARGRAEVCILDLNVEADPERALERALRSSRPTHAGVTGTTPMFDAMLRILRDVKRFDGSILTMAGGPHVSALPEEAVQDEALDIVVVGEGEETFAEILGKDVEEVRGVCFEESGSVRRTAPRDLIADLDSLPLPAWDLYDLRRYRAPAAIERHPPGGLVETSRGCPHNCLFCCKAPFGRRYRTKSPSRVVEEFRYMKRAGFRELHVEDDAFSEDVERAKEVCRALIASSPGLPWTLLNGVRADRFDGELARLLVRAGCYQCGFGVESGSRSTLDAAGKGLAPERAREAVETARRAGLETIGYFILGLPGETEESLHETIRFACELPLDYAKFSLFVPYPGSRAFDDLRREGSILTTDWSAYLFHDLEHEVFRHGTLTKAVLAAWYRKAYRRFYLRLPYVLRRLVKSLKAGTFRRMAADFIRTRW